MTRSAGSLVPERLAALGEGLRIGDETEDGVDVLGVLPAKAGHERRSKTDDSAGASEWRLASGGSYIRPAGP